MLTAIDPVSWSNKGRKRRQEGESGFSATVKLLLFLLPGRGLCVVRPHGPLFRKKQVEGGGVRGGVSHLAAHVRDHGFSFKNIKYC